tara:strand:+ start:128 stop:472 length:345 start_codon:yes stop_codon:yes gene_type:complete
MNSIVEKPWGYFEIINTGKKYLFKKIVVKPQGILSLQSHQHRSEHWIIAEGKAEVTINGKITLLTENQNIYIPKGAVHRLSNKSDTKLIVFEMWYGEILDENDIKRYEDIYERV